MRAARFQGLRQPLKVEEVADPVPEPGGVVVKVARCGICGSDLHMAEDEAFGACPGDVFGHEFSGEVVAVGNDTERVRIGDRVAVVPLSSCGHCESCMAGEPAWCSRMRLQGGGYAEYAAIHERQCVVLPETASLADGAIVEPLAVALHGVTLSGLRQGDRVLILGAGPIGLAVAYWARRFGAGKVVVQDITRLQAERAFSMGAHEFVSDVEDPVAAADRALAGKADIVFECVGVPGLIAQSVEHARVKGRIVIIGLCTRPDSFVPFRAVSKELMLITSAFFKRQEFEAALDALSRGSVEPRHLISDTIDLRDVPERFEALKKRSGECKLLISPWS